MKITDHIPLNGIWMFPLWVGSFLLGLLLLAPGTLPASMERWTLPSLAVYVLGVAMAIFLKELHHARFKYQVRQGTENDPYAGDDTVPAKGGGILPLRWIIFYASLQAALLVGLVWYSWGRGVL